jgi:hypothetical protein
MNLPRMFLHPRNRPQEETIRSTLPVSRIADPAKNLVLDTGRLSHGSLDRGHFVFERSSDPWKTTARPSKRLRPRKRQQRADASFGDITHNLRNIFWDSTHQRVWSLLHALEAQIPQPQAVQLQRGHAAGGIAHEIERPRAGDEPVRRNGVERDSPTRGSGE